jgi:DNA-binding NtrC family response regulator
MPGDLASAEKAMIAAALRQNEGNRKRAAEQLGIAERTLYRKLRRYGLS